MTTDSESNVEFTDISSKKKTAAEKADSISLLQSWHDRIIVLSKAIESEGEARATLKLSRRYLELQEMIDNAQAEQRSMLANIPDSTKDFEDAKEMMKTLLQSEGLTKFRNVHAKMGKKNTVNVSRFMRTIGGDIGIFLEVSGISQKALHEFADSNEQIKTELLQCIDTEFVMKDLEIGFTFDAHRA